MPNGEIEKPVAKVTNLAEPLPAVFIASAVAFFGLGPLLAGWVSFSSAPLLIVWVAGISLLCIIGGIISYFRNDIFGGTLNLIIGCVLFGSGTWLSFLGKFIGWPLGLPIFFGGGLPATHSPTGLPLAGLDPTIEGWMWIVLAGFLFFGAIGALRISWAIAGALLWITIAVIIGPVIWSFLGCPGIPADPTGVISNSWANTSGKMLLTFGIMLFYLGTAVLFNIHFGRKVLPIGKPLLK